MSTPEQRLRAVVEQAAPRLAAWDDALAARAPAPGKWSAKQVLGHLVDSACNNHGRFVRAQRVEHLEFGGFEQEAWVDLQCYRDAPWASLVELWRAYNLHLAHLLAAIPAAVRDAPRTRHNLQEIAWGSLPAHQPATLAWFIDDYVAHLEHHLAQAFTTLQAGRSAS